MHVCGSLAAHWYYQSLGDGNDLAPVVNMKSDIDLSAGDIIDGTASIEAVGLDVFDYVRQVASGDVLGKAEENKHREFQVWAEQSVSL